MELELQTGEAASTSTPTTSALLSADCRLSHTHTLTHVHLQQEHTHTHDSEMFGLLWKPSDLCGPPELPSRDPGLCEGLNTLRRILEKVCAAAFCSTIMQIKQMHSINSHYSNWLLCLCPSGISADSKESDFICAMLSPRSN